VAVEPGLVVPTVGFVVDLAVLDKPGLGEVTLAAPAVDRPDDPALAVEEIDGRVL
jgi:hypothetical protein